jgi:hypothetical protein
VAAALGRPERVIVTPETVAPPFTEMDFRVSPSKNALEGAVAYKYTLPGTSPSSLKEPFLDVVAVIFCPSTATLTPRDTLAVYVQHFTRDLSRSRMCLIKGYDRK